MGVEEGGGREEGGGGGELRGAILAQAILLKVVRSFCFCLVL